MFLCPKCHNIKRHLSIFTSYGPCEGCGRVTTCIDCHNSPCKPPPPVRRVKIKAKATQKGG